MLPVPAEVVLELLVLLSKCNRCDRARIGAHAQRKLFSVEAIDGVIGIGLVDIGLDIRRGTDLKMDLSGAQFGEQSGVLATTHTVADARGMELSKRLPHARGSTRLARVRCAEDALLGSIVEGANMRVKRKACLITRYIQPDHVGPPKALHQAYRLHALFS